MSHERGEQAALAYDKLQRAKRELGDAHGLMRAMEVEHQELYQAAYLNLAALAGIVERLSEQQHCEVRSRGGGNYGSRGGWKCSDDLWYFLLAVVGSLG